MALDGVTCRKSSSVNKCLIQLKRMVPSVRGHKRIKKLELLQHVINYIQDLESALIQDVRINQISPSTNELELSNSSKSETQ
ncbi:unnamed protein product [Hymenolepis diminuta]|uniref:BHLH domain-containing protein n=1 Tax=Hymenolepis diminuta TaxID=6216 RepID=A0A564YUS3_HYMDI|nr:unnamed protein product [Hymenolepis diminuta]